MDKINFENLPSTNTPINADNLNQLQTNIENAINEKPNVVDNLDSISVIDALSANQGKVLKELIEAEIYYKSGDSCNVDGTICVGQLTGGNTNVEFFIPLNKIIDNNITTVTVSLTKCNIRHSDGGYIGTNTDLADLGTISCIKCSNGIFVRLVLTTASTFTNNCPVSVHIINGKILFS